MDEFVIKYYRNLLRNGFPHSGSLDNPSVFLDSVGEKIRICGHVSHNFMHLFINISGGRIDEARYKCTCDPTANVVVEVLCSLIEKKTIAEALSLTPVSFTRVIGGGDQDYLKKIQAIMELLKRGLDRYTSTNPLECI
jgi:NifU-like protein involved in Fe-S cluster formation